MAAPSHYDHWAAAGIFFAVLAAAQATLATMLAVSTRRSVAGATIGLNAGIVVLWAASRTTGLPFGPQAGHAEVTGSADLLATGFETLSLAAAGLLLARGSLRVVRPRLTHHLIGASLTGVVLITTGLVASPSLAAHGSEAGAGEHPHAPGTPAKHDEVGGEAAPATDPQVPNLPPPAGAARPGGITGYLDVHGERVAGNPADGAALGHPPASIQTASSCAPIQPGQHAESDVAIAAADMRFDRDELRLTTGLNLVTFTNRDTAPHNLTVINPATPGCPVFEGDLVVGGVSKQYRLTLPGPGEYRFRCDLHPNMDGVVTVADHH